MTRRDNNAKSKIEFETGDTLAGCTFSFTCYDGCTGKASAWMCTFWDDRYWRSNGSGLA